jgi:hypothetical protein
MGLVECRASGCLKTAWVGGPSALAQCVGTGIECHAKQSKQGHETTPPHTVQRRHILGPCRGVFVFDAHVVDLSKSSRRHRHVHVHVRVHDSVAVDFSTDFAVVVCCRAREIRKQRAEKAHCESLINYRKAHTKATAWVAYLPTPESSRSPLRHDGARDGASRLAAAARARCLFCRAECMTFPSRGVPVPMQTRAPFGSAGSAGLGWARGASPSQGRADRRAVYRWVWV